MHNGAWIGMTPTAGTWYSGIVNIVACYSDCKGATSPKGENLRHKSDLHEYSKPLIISNNTSLKNIGCVTKLVIVLNSVSVNLVISKELREASGLSEGSRYQG